MESNQNASSEQIRARQLIVRAKTIRDDAFDEFRMSINLPSSVSLWQIDTSGEDRRFLLGFIEANA